MPGWTSITASTTAWGGGTPTTQTYTGAVGSAAVWALPRPRPEGGSVPDLDFELQFRDTGHGVFSDDRPLLFLSTLSEGQP